jgi:hypothetical protein
MSTYRNKALNFDKERKTRFGSTSSQFGKVGRNVDSESEKPKLAHENFVSRPKVYQQEEPSTSKDIREELDKLTHDEEKHPDKHSFVQRDAHPTVRKAPASTEDELVSQHKPGGAFSKAWTITDHIVIPQVIEPKKSSYIPNYLAANAILVGMERCIDGNEEFKWLCPNYLSLPVRVYYAVVYYLQIMKAKEAAGKLSRSEGSWFRSFKRVYPLESLPIAGPLVPYYSNLVAVLPNDDKYDFIYPTFDVNGGLTIKDGVPKVQPTFYLQPNVLMLTSMLQNFCCYSKSTLNGSSNDTSHYFDDDDVYVPHSFGTEFKFAGIDFPRQLNVATSAVLSNPALDNGTPELRGRLFSVHEYWRKSRCADIVEPNSTCDYDNLGDSLRMKDDFEWFEECISMATVQSKFFSDSVNMSQIPSTGGSEALISAHITGTHEMYKAPTSWYPRNWSTMKATFQTTRADAAPDQFYNAAFALSTATISWLSNGHPIGGFQCGHRLGPYWKNKEFTFQSESAVPVTVRVTTMIRSHFYDSKGNAS